MSKDDSSKSLLALSALPASAAVHVSVAFASACHNEDELRSAFCQVPTEQLEGLAFLISCMPQCDLISLRADFLRDTVKLSYEAKDSMPWGSEIPTNRFLEYVLPYSQANETREQWRAMLFELFGPQVQDLETVEAAVRFLNREVFAQDTAFMSALEVIVCHHPIGCKRCCMTVDLLLHIAVT